MVVDGGVVGGGVVDGGVVVEVEVMGVVVGGGGVDGGGSFALVLLSVLGADITKMQKCCVCK